MIDKCWTVLVAGLLSFAVTAAGATTSAADNHVPQDVFDGMRQSFMPARAQGLHVRYQFDLSGPNGGLWCIEVNDGKCRIARGKIENPNVTFAATDQDWVALSNHKLPGVWAYLTGRLKIRGDQKLARKLDEMFP